MPKVLAAPPDLNALTDEQLFQMRICDLNLHFHGTEMETWIWELYRELGFRKIRFRPECYLADEWMCPDREPVIGIPFFLAHPRLKKLEKKMVLEAEGELKDDFMSLIRHECGHAINYAYRLYRKEKWKAIFGDFFKEYPDTYVPHPYSRRYVRHLDNTYAQYHPDEDFAETFAVWLTPGSNWREEYQGWPALEKLEYVDALMAQIANREPAQRRGKKYYAAARMQKRLDSYYKKKKEDFAEELPGFYDPDLKRIFSEEAAHQKNESAAHFLWRKRKELINAVSRWTGRNKFATNKLLRQLIDTSTLQHLNLKNDETMTLLDVSSYMATRVMNYLFTGKFRVDHDKRIR